ncbi:MAG: MFS transporter [Bacteroidales bacterium]|nr:MFS transporter [Bacteroidales bacterium]
MKKATIAVLPVLLGFFVMGFSDIVGAATAQIKDQFNLSNTMANLIPSVVFVWFFFLSMPTAILMNKIGRKNAVMLSNVITIIGMLLPIVLKASLPVYLAAFALMGIGNTVIQVALNPLMGDVVSKDKLSTSITAGQVLKAVASFSGPYIIGMCVAAGWGWNAVLIVYSVIAVLGTLWLAFTKIEESPANEAAKVGESFALLKNPYILACFFAIFCIVGIDVGMNVTSPKLLQEKAGLDATAAGTASSWFFLFKTIGNFLAAFMLTKIADLKYFRWNVIGLALAIAALFFISGKMPLYIVICLVGFFEACIFGLVVSMAMKAAPGTENEASGLMITGIIGGALVSFLTGVLSDAMGGQIGSLIIIAACAAYMLICPFCILNRHKA